MSCAYYRVPSQRRPDVAAPLAVRSILRGKGVATFVEPANVNPLAMLTHQEPKWKLRQCGNRGQVAGSGAVAQTSRFGGRTSFQLRWYPPSVSPSTLRSPL